VPSLASPPPPKHREGSSHRARVPGDRYRGSRRCARVPGHPWHSVNLGAHDSSSHQQVPVLVVAQTHRPTWLRRAAVLRRDECQLPAGPPRGDYYPRGRPPGGRVTAGSRPGGKGWNKVRCPQAPASDVPALVWRSVTDDPPPGREDPSPPTPGTSKPGGSTCPPPSAIDPAGLSQTWRCGAPPAALGTKGRRTN